MCGIAGVYLKKPDAGNDDGMNQFADALLREIEPRGRHATGFVSIGWDRSVKVEKAAKPATEFIKERERFQDGVQSVLLHTRFWTKGKPEEGGNNHPVIYNTCFATHNGSISNDDELFEKEKLKRNHEVDSEVIPALLDKHGLDHPDKIRAALEKFQGPMAIAAIDPIKAPTRLVLAKGASSPLYIFENQNVIMWASTHKAIIDAWGAVIGTPPRGDKVKFVSEGKFFIADDYGQLGKYEFDVPKAPARTTRYVGRGTGFQERTGQVGPNRGQSKEVPKPWDSKGPFNTRGEFDSTLRTFRQSSAIRARLWRMRDLYTDEDFADVKGAKCWFNCPTCSSSVLKEDLISHLKYGEICNDCASVIASKYQSNAEAAKEKREVDEYPIPELVEADRNNLESWAKLEARAHRYALNEVSDQTGYSMQALDYLIFRTATVGADFGSSMIGAKVALRRLYEKVLESIYEDHSDELMAELETEDKMTVATAQEIAEGLFYPWMAYSETEGGRTRIKYVCEDHGEQFPFGDSCITCGTDDPDINTDYSLDYSMGSCGVHPGDEDEPWPGETRGSEDSDTCGVVVEAKPEKPDSEMHKCPTCRAWTTAENQCLLCRKKREEKREVIAELEQAEVTECCCKATRDRKCRKKMVVIVTNSVIGKRLGYCSPHWNKCSSGKCNAESNFTTLDGKRWCHKHARSKQGIADAAVAGRGEQLVIEEV